MIDRDTQNVIAACLDAVARDYQQQAEAAAEKPKYSGYLYDKQIETLCLKSIVSRAAQAKTVKEKTDIAALARADGIIDIASSIIIPREKRSIEIGCEVLEIFEKVCQISRAQLNEAHRQLLETIGQPVLAAMYKR